MALYKYKISYNDGTAQTVTCDRPAVQGDWLLFGDGSGELLRVKAADVSSVNRAETPDVSDRK